LVLKIKRADGVMSLRRRRWRWIGGFIAVLVVFLAAMLWHEFDRRAGLYWYDVQQDYRYCFRDAVVSRLDIPVGTDGFEFPIVEHQWDTALLELEVSSTLAGWWFEPAIDIGISDGREARQHFERGASGVRLVELGISGPQSIPSDRIVRLSGRHLRWPSQTGRLLLFDNRVQSESSLLVLAPHPDDAEIAAFGLYSGRDAHVVTITNGSYSADSYIDIVSDPVRREDLEARLRVWDSLVVPRWGGLEEKRAINLGYFTLTLEQMRANPTIPVPNPVSGSTDIEPYRSWKRTAGQPQKPARPTWESLVDDLSTLLREIAPRVIVAPHPVLDAARDHVYTTLALFEAIERVAGFDAILLLYTNHHTLSDYYPFGPADSRVGIPPWFDCSVPFGGVLSYPLDEEQQVVKLFALDAMHDLRRMPHRELGGPAFRVLERAKRALDELWRDPAGEHSYFRRAVRPNELFFVYSVANGHAIRRLTSAAQERLP